MTKKKLWIIVAVLCLAVCLCACRKDDSATEPSETVAGTEPAAMSEYTVELVSEGGMPLENISMYIYTDETLADLIWFARTDAEGKISFTATSAEGAVAVLEGVPDGYQVEESYPLTGSSTTITLVSAMLSDEDLTGVSLELGDMMYDLKVTATDGTEYQISELLKEKTAVVLNFWYLECQPCRMEFPYLQEAYEAYSDQIEVLALNPVDTDADAVAAFQEEMGLTFPMALCNPDWQNAMQLTAYPTTVVIDRYGTISLIHKGSIPEAEVFETIFEYYISEDYQQGQGGDLDEILAEAEEAAYQMTIGTADNPDEFSGVSSREITVPAGEKYYCNIYKVDTMYLRISDPDAYVIYNGSTYRASGGAVSLTITSEDVSSAVNLVVGNSGNELKTFTMRLSMPQGTQSNPYSLSLGQFTVNVAAGNDQGVCYRYTCKQSGTIVAKCLSISKNVAYDLTLYNLNTYALRNMQNDSAVDEDGNRLVTIKVNKGDTLLFTAGTLPDSSGYYPSAKLKVEVGYSTDKTEEEENKQEDQENQEGQEGQKPEEPAADPIVYSVTVTDENRKGIPGAQVYLLTEQETIRLVTDDDGIAASKVVPGTYSVVLMPPAGYDARTTDFVLTEKIPSIAVKLDAVEEEERPSVELPNIGMAYYVELGESQLKLAYSSAADIYNYFVFEPEKTGLYQVTTTDPDAQISYWATTAFPYNASAEVENNTLDLNIKLLHEGLGYVIGVTGAKECTLVITRIGDPILDETDAQWSEAWKDDLTEPPTKQFTLKKNGSKLTYVNLESKAKAYYNSSDGYYHLNSKTGPILYVNLGPEARYVSLYNMLGFAGDGGGAQNLSRYFYDKKGNFVKKEKYTDWMRQYIEMRDETYDVYPLTDTLIYMIQNGGEQIGWWTEDSGTYKFSDIDLNEDIAWMFACCYIPN